MRVFQEVFSYVQGFNKFSVENNDISVTSVIFSYNLEKIILICVVSLIDSCTAAGNDTSENGKRNLKNGWILNAFYVANRQKVLSYVNSGAALSNEIKAAKAENKVGVTFDGFSLNIRTAP